MRWLGIVAAVVAALCGYAYWKVSSQTFTYRYRLQLALSVDEKIHTGSSVVEIVWQCGRSYGNNHDELGPCYASVGGQATLIDLGSRGVIVATLQTGENIHPVPDGAVSAVWLCSFAFGNRSTNAELPALRRLKGRAALTPANLPRLVWFSNAADPASATKITVENVQRFIDPSARFTEAFVEITTDPIVVDIPDKLPWFSEMKRLFKSGRGPLSKSGEFQLVYNMFVGENS